MDRSRRSDRGSLPAGGKGALGAAILVILLPLAPDAFADQAPRPISLTEAVTLAQRNSPRTVDARGRTRSGEARTRSATAAFLPSLSFNAGATRQLPSEGDRTRIEDGQLVTIPDEPWSFGTGVGANLLLFDGGRRMYGLKAAKATLQAAEIDEDALGWDVAFETKQQYLAVLAYREAQAAAKASLDQTEQQLRAAILRVRAGSATKSDSLRSDIQVRNARLAVLIAQSNEVVASASLTRAVGTPYPVTASGADTSGLVGLSVSEAELLLLAEAAPTVRRARADLMATQAVKQGSRGAYFPTISAGYSYSGSGTDSRFGFGDDPFSYGGSLRLSLSLPLFDQFGREEDIIRADVAEESADAALRDARLAALESLAQYLAAYQTAEVRVVAQTASLGSAEEDLRVQQQRYGVGASTLLDLLASQTQINQAREALIRARYDQRIAKAQLEALVGRSL